MSEVDDIVEKASATLDRSRARYRAVGTKSRAMRRAFFWRKLGRMLIAAGGVVVLAALFGALIQPLGFVGMIATVALVIGALIVFANYPDFPEPTVADLGVTDLKTLAGKTEIWLEAQRPALPAPAQKLVDDIGVQLDLLAPQLQGLSANTPAAFDVRKLVGEDLTALVSGYRQVPQQLRREARNGRTPDDQLLDGLKVIEREIGDTARQLASGSLDELATRGRYLEIKYQGE